MSDVEKKEEECPKENEAQIELPPGWGYLEYFEGVTGVPNA